LPRFASLRLVLVAAPPPWELCVLLQNPLGTTGWMRFTLDCLARDCDTLGRPMKTVRSLVFLLFCTAALGVAAPADDARSIEAEIARLDARRVEALLKNDVKALEQLFSDDLVYIHSAGKIDSKQPYLASLATGNLTYVSLTYDPPARVSVASRDTAVVTGRATIEVKNRAGQLTKRVLTTTTVYVRQAAGWRVVSYQGTPVSP
jgi:uncharacterized protein (TIGR02246 family)